MEKKGQEKEAQLVAAKKELEGEKRKVFGRGGELRSGLPHAVIPCSAVLYCVVLCCPNPC